APPFAASQTASPLSRQHVLDRGVLQGQLCIQAFELGVLGLQLPNARQLRYRHARVLALPGIPSRCTDAVLAAHLSHRYTGFSFLQDRHDLAFAELAFLHRNLVFFEAAFSSFRCLPLGEAYDGSKIAEAIDYSLNAWRALTLHLEDGAVVIDNNLIGRQIKPWKIGAKNWLFVGSELAGQCGR